MAIDFRLPDLGEGITEAEMVRWLVKPGDHVELDQAIAEVQTDKALVELPAPVAGTILDLNVAEGQIVPVDTVLVTLDEVSSAGRVSGIESARPLESKQSRGSGLDAASGTDRSGRWSAVSIAPRRQALATPVVRRLARELELDITRVQGSGPAGRVLAEDLRVAAATPVSNITQTVPGAESDMGAEPAVAVIEQGARSPVVTPRPIEEGPGEERQPLRGLRRRIAENMMLSVRTIPQVTSFVEVDATRLVELRQSLLAEAETRGIKLTYLAVVVKALTQTLRAFPYINAAIDDETHEIVVKRHIHVGIATATLDGLLVPVLRHADRLTIAQIAAELTRLAETGRERKLTVEELRGSTFTITNFGAAGGYFATPLINPGESAILGLGRIAERPWAIDGRVEARPILPLSFTADHRLIDGELALQFLNALVARLESPNRLLFDMV